MERKRPQEGTQSSGSTSTRISVFALLETLLCCGLWITLSTQERQLRSAQIHPTCSWGNKGEVNSLIQGPVPIKINRSGSSQRKSCPTGFLGKNKDGFSPCSTAKVSGSFPLGREGQDLFSLPLPSLLSLLARCTGDLR